MAKGLLRGHKINYDYWMWRYADTGEPTAGNPRPCGNCNADDRTDGHDACIGELKGVMNACCGHGDTSVAYIQFLDGSTLQGKAASMVLEMIKLQTADV